MNPRYTIPRIPSCTIHKRYLLMMLLAVSCLVLVGSVSSDTNTSSASSVGSTFDVNGVMYEVIDQYDVIIVDVSGSIDELIIESTVTNPRDSWDWDHWVSKTYNITGAEDDAFAHAYDLVSIGVSGNIYFSSDEGILMNPTGTEILCYPMAMAGAEYTIPDTVEKIGSYAFCRCDNLEIVTVGSNVTEIGDHAFLLCWNLETVTVGSGLTSIEDHTFYNCRDLGTFTTTSSVSSIGEYAFYGCDDLYTVCIGPDLSVQTGLVNMGSCVTDIGGCSFCYCDSIENLYIGVPTGSSPITVREYAFYGCGELANVVLGCSVKTIENDAFHHCDSLSAIIIPTSVTSIGMHAFIFTSLKAVAIPKTTKVSASAFEFTLLGGPWKIYYGGDHIMSAVLERVSSSVFSGNNYMLTVVTESGYVIKDFSYSGDTSDVTRVGDTNVWKIHSGYMSTGDHAITFSTGILSYTIDTEVSNGTITPDSNVDYGEDITIYYSTTSGYSLVSVVVDGVKVTGHDSSYTFSNVTSDHTISVTYESTVLTVTVGMDAHTSVSYTVNGGSEQTYTNPFVVNYGDDVTLTAMVDTGYHFVQWASGVTSNPLTVNVENSLSYYAESTEDTFVVTLAHDSHISSITYSVNGGPSKIYTSSFNVDYGDDVIFTAVIDSGYHFVQWASGVTSNPLTVTDIESDLSYSAVSAEDTFTVTLSADSGISSIYYSVNGGAEHTYVGSFETYYGDVLTITANISVGYTFDSWSGTFTSTYNPLTINVIDDVSLSAGSVPNTYIVTFTGNYSASTYSVSITETYGTNYILPDDNPVRDGYYFGGWYTESTGGSQITSSTMVFITSDTTVYAHWNAHSGGDVDLSKVIPLFLIFCLLMIVLAFLLNTYFISKKGYSVIFDPNGGSGKMGKKMFLFGTTERMPDNMFTRDGYRFTGWSTDPNGPVIYAEGQEVGDLVSRGDKSITLYAVWEELVI